MSLIQFYTSRGRQPAWLGIFAILMLFIAPVISRSLEHARIGEAHSSKVVDCHMVISSNDDMPRNMSHSEVSSASHVSSGTNHHDGMQMGMHAGGGMSMLEDIACGYCVFLIHVPMLDLANTPLFWSTSLTARPPPIQTVASFLPHFIFSDSLPRAPPGQL
ncbi:MULTISPECIES: DUF2946 domain-containing protein [Photorhabdus]|uniref:Transmembrane protein n=2 Tax=Photorhabdus asymbiotica TaxID=291112 RepID=B6VKA2_PHOAA|nr:DUF2946 domain-containing protein [Photorhabdus asymbiotica]RKS66710.1 DUF2946 family protein [Photorhabdus asymbiotica]CAQ83332.1 Putative transmembrane protein [Photorhabdus asymbiotica]CAR66582.1 Putative transmembrane protein [Photorhabdus asymbiotica subsp. asymbiotica ATCC 43949]